MLTFSLSSSCQFTYRKCNPAAARGELLTDSNIFIEPNEKTFALRLENLRILKFHEQCITTLLSTAHFSSLARKINKGPSLCQVVTSTVSIESYFIFKMLEMREMD